MKQPSKKVVKGWAIAGDWDKGIFWWYDAEDLDQFQIYRTKRQAHHALREWKKNSHANSHVVRCEMTYEVPDGE